MTEGGEPNPAIEVLFSEERRFAPSEQLRARSRHRDPAVYERALADPDSYWAEQARRLVWRRPFDTVCDWSNAPFARWFVGGRLNVTESCLDRHAASDPDRVAYYFEGEPGDRRVITYGQLLRETCRLANGLASLGVKKGDRVAIYMGLVPELAVALLACARLGAVHSVVFGGFSAQSLADRLVDARAAVVITCDGAWRNGSVVPLKEMADEAAKLAGCVEKMVVYRRTMTEISMEAGRDIDWNELLADKPDKRPAEEMDSEDLLFLLYTSGTTARPKGIAHTTAGYVTGAAWSHDLVFDYQDGDVYWCSADIGWITGHSYVVYGPLANGATSVMYEGAPSYPYRDRWWDIIEQYKVNIFYTAPTAIRTAMKWGDAHVKAHDLTSLRLLGTVGEPINPEAWMWYRDVVGGGRAPVVDTWWQTETGHIMISPVPALTETKPGSATRALPGIVADVFDEEGRSVPLGEGGYLVLTRPWPGMLRTLYNDDERFVEVYWRRFSRPEEGVWIYFAGDGVRRDEDGYFWFLGRVDDVMNVSGHRISTLEVESALVDHPGVAEAAVVGRADDRTGQAIAAFVTLRSGVDGDSALMAELREHVANRIGKIARPASIVFTDELPKTRSGKIMRRLLRDIANRRQLGDVTTLANSDVVAEIAREAEAQLASQEG
jgi:acetyl-CoA synthetase